MQDAVLLKVYGQVLVCTLPPVRSVALCLPPMQDTGEILVRSTPGEKTLSHGQARTSHFRKGMRV